MTEGWYDKDYLIVWEERADSLKATIAYGIPL